MRPLLLASPSDPRDPCRANDTSARPPSALERARADLILQFRLTPGQARVLGPLCACHEDNEIAALLGLGTETVRSHVRAILRKMNLTSRRAVVRVFLEALDATASANVAPPGDVAR